MAATLKDLKDGKGPVVPPQTPPPKTPTAWDLYASRLISTTPPAAAAVPKGLQTGASGAGFGVGADIGNARGDLWTRPAGDTGPANPNGGGPGPNGSPLPGYSMSQILSGMPGVGKGVPPVSSPYTPRTGGGTPATPAAAFATPERVAQDRLLMSQADWLTKYGNINFDANAIKGIFDAATNAAYAAKDREYAATERKFYDQKGTEQLSILDAKRRAAAQNAVQTGANRGMQNAAQLTDVLQQSASAAPDALALAEARRALIDQAQAELVANAKEAELLAEQRKLDYAKVGSEIYATDAQKYVGELGYDSAVLDSAITKYGIDRTALNPGAVAKETLTQQRGAYTKLYEAAQASGDIATAQMAASMLGIIAMKLGG